MNELNDESLRRKSELFKKIHCNDPSHHHPLLKLALSWSNLQLYWWVRLPGMSISSKCNTRNYFRSYRLDCGSGCSSPIRWDISRKPSLKILLRFQPLIFALLIGLTSCRKHCLWKHCRIETVCPKYFITRSFLQKGTPYDPIEIEIISTPKESRLYIDLLFITLPEHISKIPISFSIDGIIYESEASVFEGGQRLLLEESSTAQILEALFSGSSVKFLFDSYPCELFPFEKNLH